MADSGKEVLDRDSKIADFCAYLDILRRHRQDFAVSDVSFVAIPDKSGMTTTVRISGVLIFS
ncbi:hypothetical protein [Mycobacteroides abscessus]|uniref:hypothetical protein n=1 Tax=Mycobacteroides abscessus TaxID=36809 RepID=UPI000DBBAA7B|nr:hypothetical protein [Mycobacteroides abscessus]BBB39526.1 hypothetical protein MASB_00920 [Mycobacteroides abscessus subsp. bolletii BD]